MLKTSVYKNDNVGYIIDIHSNNYKNEVCSDKKKDNNVKDIHCKDKSTFTTMVRIKGSKNHKVLPVKSSKEIDKALWIECSKALSRLYVGPPIKLGDIICKNILNTGVDILSCRSINVD